MKENVMVIRLTGLAAPLRLMCVH